MLKKVLSIILAGILLLTLTACSRELSETAKSSGDELTVSQTISVTSDQQKKEEIEETDDTTDVHSEKDSGNSNVISQADGNLLIPATDANIEGNQTTNQNVEETKPHPKPKETPTVSKDNENPKETVSKVVESNSEETKETESNPQTTTTESKPVKHPETTTSEPQNDESQNTELPKPFDIDHWLNYAKNYAQSKGLVLDNCAVDCWDNPIRAGSHCEYLERDLQSRLNRYAKDKDITDVWIWVEPVENDCYDIYIGYA